MKLKLTLIILVLFGALSASNSYAQTNGSKTIIDPKNPGSDIALSDTEFGESVLVVPDLSVFQGKPKSKKLAVTMQLVNFRSDRKFLPVYTINGIGYNDDGKYNDQLAGDGIFTSVKKVTYMGEEAGKKKHFLNASEFKFNDALTNYYIKNNVDTNNKSIGFTCQIRLITCPETNWWDSCWPLSSPCTCVDFYDCVLDVTML